MHGYTCGMPSCQATKWNRTGKSGTISAVEEEVGPVEEGVGQEVVL